MDLRTPLSQALSTTKTFLALLAEVGVTTIENLLLYYPRAHERMNEAEASTLSEEGINTIHGILRDVRNEPTRSGKKITKALLETVEGDIEVVWFNQPYLERSLPKDREVTLIGKAKFAYGKWSLQAPRVELAGGGADMQSARTGEGQILAIYPAHDKLTSHWIREKVQKVIHLASLFPENLPTSVVISEKLMPRSAAIQQIHFPDSQEELERAKERLAFEELFFIQQRAHEEKKAWQKTWEGERKQIPFDPEQVKKFLSTLPFQLTTGQKISLFEILRDMDQDYPMMRLLEGDVGSGKTVVAACAAAMAIDAGFQVSVMAPTEVLARQLFASMSKMMEEYGKVRGKPISVHFLIGALTMKEKRETTLGVASGMIDLVVGTHALVQETVSFFRLGLAIIDEQHRFGVEQRDRFRSFGSPHILHMTATPIPRSLALVAYGDHDLSVIAELPPGRKPIHTKIVAPKGRKEVYYFIEEEVKKGRQIYVICPLVEESEKLEAKAATEEWQRLSLDIFPKLRLGLMHGRLPSAEKEKVMQKFKAGEFDILVSTSVVEVGVDVPNATIMLIEGSERFGLSQLHQFRGRVGRGEHQSHCFLFTESESESSQMRLRAMEQTNDGFRLAEIDMRLRGPGEVYGVRQSGIPDLKMANLADTQFVDRVRKAVEKNAK